MKYSDNCYYCTQSKQLKEMMIEIAPLEVSTLFLVRDQTHRGRCVVAHREHTKEIFDLPKGEFEAFMRDVARAAKAVDEAVKPDKLNYGSFADTNPHLHFHLVPKYKDGCAWGKIFEMAPAEKRYLSEEEYQALVAEIKSHL